MPAIVRSVIAVVAGYATMAVVVIALSVIVTKVAPGWMGNEGAPNATYVVTNLIYSLAAAMLGGYVAATIGSRAPLAHTSPTCESRSHETYASNARGSSIVMRTT